MRINLNLEGFNKVVGYLTANGFYMSVLPVYDGVVCKVYTKEDAIKTDVVAFDFTIHGASMGHKEGLLEITGRPFADDSQTRAVDADELIHLIEKSNLEAERPISEEELKALRIVDAYLKNTPIQEIALMLETTAADVLEVAMWYEKNKDNENVKTLFS